MSSQDHSPTRIAGAAALFTAATAFFGLLAENFAVVMNEGLLPAFPAWSRTLIGGVLFAFCTFLFWRADGLDVLLRRKKDTGPLGDQRRNNRLWRALGAFTLMAAMHGFLGINVAQWAHQILQLHGGYAAWLGALLFFLSVLLFWRVRGKEISVSAEQIISKGVFIREENAPPYGGILAVLSVNSNDPKDTEACSAAQVFFDAKVGAADGNWEKAITALTNEIAEPPILFRWNGQQPLRSVANVIANFNDAKPLTLVRLIYTQESAERYPAYAALLRHILQKHPNPLVQSIAIEEARQVLVAGGTWESNKQKLAAALDELKRDPRCKNGKICLDITGGSADLSVTGAVATISESAKLRYVYTNAPFNAHNYDLQAHNLSTD